MCAKIKILFVLNVAGREMKTVSKIVGTIKEINRNADIDIIEARSPTFLTDILEANPNVLITFPFSAIGLSYTSIS